MMEPTLQDIQAAAARIKPYVHRTPVLTCTTLNNMSGAQLFFKCENFQKIGAFKFRGACNAVCSLSAAEASKGVATHSSGNHAAALSLAAKLRGIAAFIVMPRTSSEVKKQAVQGYGGQITYCEPNQKAREDMLEKVIAETGATMVHPYNDYRVIAGQGTAALELVQDYPDLDFVIAPVGGGGLVSGTAIATLGLSPKTKIIAAEPKGADDAYRAFQLNKIVHTEDPQSICDGLLTGQLGDKTFPIIKKYVSQIMLAEEEEIIQATKLIWERMKIVVEPSAAVTLAVILANKDFFAGKKIGVIVSGGNVDIKKLAGLF